MFLGIQSLCLLEKYLFVVEGIDYLLCQFAADKKLSTFEGLPAEILEIIYEEVGPLS